MSDTSEPQPFVVGVAGPPCPKGHGPMEHRRPHTREQAWCGAWFDCPEHHCGTTILLRSRELQAQYEKAGLP
jgi:hypothetical protein